MAQTYIDIAAVDPATDVTVISNDADVTVTKETVDGMDVITVEKPTTGNWWLIFDQFAVVETTDWEVWCAIQVIEYGGTNPATTAAGVAGNIIDANNNYQARSRDVEDLVVSDRSDQFGINSSLFGESAVLTEGRLVGVRMRLEPDFTQRAKHWFESISGGESATLDMLVANESPGWDGSRTPVVELGAGQIGICAFRGGIYRFYAVGIGTDGDPAPTEPVGVGGEIVQVVATDNITTSDVTEGTAKAVAFAPSGITLDTLLQGVATAREITVDTLTAHDFIPASARAGGSVEEQTAATDVKFGLIDEFLSFLIENGLISEETLADISAVSATEEGVSLVDITSARSILFEEIAELTETNDAAVAVMKSLGLTREDVLFGDEIIPSIADVIVVTLQSTFFTETRALGTAEMLDVIASSAALEDTVISKIISVVGNVIEENATFGAITSARMIAVIRSLEDVTLSEIVEARSLTRGFIGETLAFDDAVQFRLIDKLWVTAQISVELKILTESIDIKPKR